MTLRSSAAIRMSTQNIDRTRAAITYSAARRLEDDGAGGALAKVAIVDPGQYVEHFLRYVAANDQAAAAACDDCGSLAKFSDGDLLWQINFNWKYVAATVFPDLPATKNPTELPKPTA